MAIIVPPAPIDNPNFTSYTWVDWYQKVRNAINQASVVSWSSITGTPTSLSGYGITNSITVSSVKFTWGITPADNSAGFTGTLTNSPKVGNPTKWVEVDDNGTTRYLPLW